MQRSAQRLVGAVIASVLPLTGPAGAQLRAAEWNVTNYGGGGIEALEKCLYGAFEGRSLAPDVLICQKFLNQDGVN